MADILALSARSAACEPRLRAPSRSIAAMARSGIREVTDLALARGGSVIRLLFIVPLAVVEAFVVPPPDLSPLGVAALVYLGVAASAATFLLWNFALNAVGASVAGTFVNLIPVFGLAFALIAGESISAVQLAGGAAVALGVWLAASPARPS